MRWGGSVDRSASPPPPCGTGTASRAPWCSLVTGTERLIGLVTAIQTPRACVMWFQTFRRTQQNLRRPLTLPSSLHSFMERAPEPCLHRHVGHSLVWRWTRRSTSDGTRRANVRLTVIVPRGSGPVPGASCASCRDDDQHQHKADPAIRSGGGGRST
jgi:hypothetical protein